MPLLPRKTAPVKRAKVHRYNGRLSRKDYEPVALLAAARALEAGRTNEDGSRKAATPVMPVQQWQTRALGYYDMMGEARNPAQFVSSAMSKMRFYPARLDDQGKAVEIKESEDPDVVAAVSVLQKVAPDAGRLLWLIGDGRLCQFRDRDDAPDDPVKWEFLSPVEIKITDEGRVIERNATGSGRMLYKNITDEENGAEPQPGEMRTWRFWKPDPTHSELADSPVRAILDLLEQLWWLTMSERADLQNRIADNGIMLVPSELEWEPPGGADAEATGEDTEDGTLVEYLAELVLGAIGDPGSPSGATPGLIEGKAEFLEYIRMLHTHEGSIAHVYVGQREQSLITRIAQNLPLPVEAIVGMSTANHWTAWKVEDEKWQAVEPWITGFAEDATEVFLLPFLRASGKDEEIFVAYDYSALVSDPDKGKVAIQLHKDGILKAVAALAANGWGEDDLMDGEELDWWRAIALSDATVATGEAPEGEGTPPAEDDAVGEERPEDASLQAVKRQMLAFANRNARTKIGAALRGRKRSCSECLEGLEDVPNEKLLQALDGPTLERLGLRPSAVVDQLTATFIATVEALGWNASDHFINLAEWFALTLHEPEELSEDLIARIGRRDVVAR